jgi:hypothetical protein
MKNYVGKKIIGFRFDDFTDEVYWNEIISNHIGKIGEIIFQGETYVTVQFKNGTCYYPISLIKKHLVEEEPEISGLEALFIVHGGWYGEEQKILYDKCVKIILEEKQRLQSIYIKSPPKYTHDELVEKLEHDFEEIISFIKINKNI